MNLVIFTNFFPYKRYEPFLVNELAIARTHCRTLRLFTLYGIPADNLLDKSARADCLEPVFKSAGNRTSLLLKGLFNLSPFSYHAREFWSERLYLQPSRAYWWMVSCLMSRAAMSSKAWRQLIAHLDKLSDGTLYFYWGDNLCWLVPYLRRKLAAKNIKIVVRFHGSDLYEHFKAGYAPLRNQVLNCSDQVFTISEHGRNYLKERYPQHASKIMVARLGVADGGLNPSLPTQTNKVVVSVSNVIPIKRIDLIYKTLLNTQGPVTWHHFGDGPMFRELKELCKQGRPGLEIVLHGYVKNPEILLFYSQNKVDVFLNVSSSEGVPVSIMEALAFGIPVMATGVGGTAELVSTKSGYLIDKDFSTETLSSLLNRFLMADEETTAALRQGARETYIQMASLKNYDNFYEKLKSL